MVKTKNEKMIKTKYKYLAVLTIVSLNFYSQKIDTVKILNQLWSAKKITCSRIQNGELIIGSAKPLQTAIEKHPNDIILKANLAHLYLITGQFEKAKQIYIDNVIKMDTIQIVYESYGSDGNITYINNGLQLSKNDTTWIKMIQEDFSYFKKEGITCKDFDVITTIFNVKKENQKLRKQVYEDETSNNDSAIYKLNKIISSHYFIEEKDYVMLLEYYLKNKELASAEKFFNECIQKHKVNEAKFYDEFGCALISSKLYKPAVNYLKIGTLKCNNYNLKVKVHYATAFLLSGEIEPAKKIFTENIFETDSIVGHIGLDGDSLIVFDSVNNKYNFIRMVGVETDWMTLVKWYFEKLERNGIECEGFDEVNQLLISEHDALMRKRIELKKQKQ